MRKVTFDICDEQDTEQMKHAKKTQTLGDESQLN